MIAEKPPASPPLALMYRELCDAAAGSLPLHPLPLFPTFSHRRLNCKMRRLIGADHRPLLGDHRLQSCLIRVGSVVVEVGIVDSKGDVLEILLER
jgi:hypothetical protein